MRRGGKNIYMKKKILIIIQAEPGGERRRFLPPPPQGLLLVPTRLGLCLPAGPREGFWGGPGGLPVGCRCRWGPASPRVGSGEGAGGGRGAEPRRRAQPPPRTFCAGSPRGRGSSCQRPAAAGSHPKPPLCPRCPPALQASWGRGHHRLCLSGGLSARVCLGGQRDPVPPPPEPSLTSFNSL